MKQACLITALMITVSGCAHEVSRQPLAADQRAPEPLNDQSVALEVGILGSWKLETVAGEAVAGNQLSITFQPRFFDANVNCNKVSGFYSLRANMFVPDRAVASERGCGPQYALDTFLTRSLQFGMTLTMPSKNRLVAQAKGQELVFVRIGST